MNFRFFSLVGFVCACAPFGVSSTQEVDNDEVTLKDGFFQVFLDNFNEIKEDLRELKMGQGINQKADHFLSQILENNQLVCRLFEGCGLQIILPDGAYSPSAYLDKLTQGMPTAETEAKEPRQLLDVIQLQLAAQKELLSMLANGCGIKNPSEAQPDNQ